MKCYCYWYRLLQKCNKAQYGGGGGKGPLDVIKGLVAYRFSNQIKINVNTLLSWKPQPPAYQVTLLK